MQLDTPVQYLKNVGPKTAEKFARLGVYTVADLLAHYPRRYVDYAGATGVAAAPFDTDTVVRAVVYAKLPMSRLPGGRTLHRAQACSTKLRGISAVSSSSTPARVLPWISAALDSSRPPKSKNRFSLPWKRTVRRFSDRFSRQRNPSPCK